MNIIDSHSHPYVEEFKDDVDEVLQRAQAAGIRKIYMPAIDSTTHAAMLDVEAKHPNLCVSMMGLHPCSVNGNWKEELKTVKGWLDRRTFAAVGEIGLDYYWDKTHVEQQRQAFAMQMQWALEAGLPIVIHARDATPDCIEMVQPFAAKGLKGIFHCFGGTAAEAKAIIDLGFLLGIGGVFTFKKANMPDHLKDISLDHIVLETDAPYLAPVPYRGKRNESSYLIYIAQALATAKHTSVEEVAAITAKNAENLFKI